MWRAFLSLTSSFRRLPAILKPKSRISLFSPPPPPTPLPFLALFLCHKGLLPSFSRSSMKTVSHYFICSIVKNRELLLCDGISVRNKSFFRSILVFFFSPVHTLLYVVFFLYISHTVFIFYFFVSTTKLQGCVCMRMCLGYMSECNGRIL